MSDTWATEIGALLAELSDVQTDLLAVLAEKREMLAASNLDALHEMTAREQLLLDRLQACHDRRQQLLVRAGDEGLPADSIGSLSGQLPFHSRALLEPEIEDVAKKSRLLQHESLTNWVLVQRTLLHLSQMIEIIATGGRSRPTYGNGSDRALSGTLVDRAA
jgi:flagellar biosynthesis/type III secretory pathway chaperone